MLTLGLDLSTLSDLPVKKVAGSDSHLAPGNLTFAPNVDASTFFYQIFGPNFGELQQTSLAAQISLPWDLDASFRYGAVAALYDRRTFSFEKPGGHRPPLQGPGGDSLPRHQATRSRQPKTQSVAAGRSRTTAARFPAIELLEKILERIIWRAGKSRRWISRRGR
jgi:hypothetical protein